MYAMESSISSVIRPCVSMCVCDERGQTRSIGTGWTLESQHHHHHKTQTPQTNIAIDFQIEKKNDQITPLHAGLSDGNLRHRVPPYSIVLYSTILPVARQAHDEPCVSSIDRQ